MATDKDGREWLVAVAKGTYSMPDGAEREPILLDEQAPLVMTDVFTGMPGLSATLYEIDFALRKMYCDVVLNGSCYAPRGRPATKVQVGLRVGRLTKSFNVVGNRVWRSNSVLSRASSPEPFTVQPISYGNAYGGIDKPSDDPATHTWYPLNHAGLGYHPRTSGAALSGKPLPNTEEVGRPVSRPDGSYLPMAFGCVGRGWQQRIKWAGTYDQKWRDETFPFLPSDFDERYFQSAPEDQQTDFLRGGEEVVLVHLTPSGRAEFRIPPIDEPFVVLYKDGEEKRVSGVVDTLVLEPDLGRFMLSLRASLPLRRSLHEIREVTIGRALIQPVAEEGEEPPVVPKPRYRSLAELVAANRRAGVK